jgi:hypothetical protein
MPYIARFRTKREADYQPYCSPPLAPLPGEFLVVLAEPEVLTLLTIADAIVLPNVNSINFRQTTGASNQVGYVRGHLSLIATIGV